MFLRSLYVRGYRSIRTLRLPLNRVNVLVGPNGSGKSNLYRSLYLLAAAAEGRFARSLVEEGGMPSVLWAGEQRKDLPKRVELEVQFDDWLYHFSCGLRKPSGSAFGLDPYIREEWLDLMDSSRKVRFFCRTNAAVWLRDQEGRRIDYPWTLSESESVLSEIREPHRFPELSQLRGALLNWRFYHQFRTDVASPLRQPQMPVRTPILGNDGSDLASALQSIREMGDYGQLDEAIADAFPGGELQIESSDSGLQVALKTPEFKRPFTAPELSDGTLKYLCLLAALLSPRPPQLLALNEPDANLHPQLYEPLARLVAKAANFSQLWIATHSVALAALLKQHAAATSVVLKKKDGATIVEPSEE